MNRKKTAFHRFSLIFETLGGGAAGEEFQKTNAAEVSARPSLRSPAEGGACGGAAAPLASLWGQLVDAIACLDAKARGRVARGSRLDLQLGSFGGAGAGVPELPGR